MRAFPAAGEAVATARRPGQPLEHAHTRTRLLSARSWMKDWEADLEQRPDDIKATAAGAWGAEPPDE